MTHNTDRDGVSHGKLSRVLKMAVLKAKLEEFCGTLGFSVNFCVKSTYLAHEKELKIPSNYESFDGFSSLDSLNRTHTTAGGGVNHGNLSKVLVIRVLKDNEEEEAPVVASSNQ